MALLDFGATRGFDQSFTDIYIEVSPVTFSSEEIDDPDEQKLWKVFPVEPLRYVWSEQWDDVRWTEPSRCSFWHFDGGDGMSALWCGENRRTGIPEPTVLNENRLKAALWWTNQEYGPECTAGHRFLLQWNKSFMLDSRNSCKSWNVLAFLCYKFVFFFP